MISREDIDELIVRVETHRSNNFLELVRVSGLDPKVDFRFANLQDIDLSGLDLTGFDFTGAHLSGCKFNQSKISGACFEDAELDVDALRSAADWALLHSVKERNTPSYKQASPKTEPSAISVPPQVSERSGGLDTIFISYRRKDSIGIARLVYEKLIDHFGDGTVFMDIDVIPPGTNFREHINGSMERAKIVLALIGEGWGHVQGNGHSHLHDPTDFVRIELELALGRSIPIIPVLIGQTNMPTESELPASIAKFADYNATMLDLGRDFHSHTNRLIQDVERHLRPGGFKADPGLPGERDLSVSHNNISDVHRIQGNLAVESYKAALAVAKRLTEAEPLTRRALVIDEKSYGPDHPNVARDLNNLAQLLKDTNRITEAEPLMHRALGIDEKSYGPDHPIVARDLNNLAQLLKDMNRLTEAEPLMRRALGIDEKSYGPDHSNVARDLNNLAQLLKDTNRLTEAEPLMRRALGIDERNYGPDHSNVARDLNNLAQLLQDTNRLTEAEPLMRRALSIDERNYGPDHPTVATDLNNLAQLLQDTNRLTEAEPLMRRALVICIISLGTTHPNTQTAKRNLDALLAKKPT